MGGLVNNRLTTVTAWVIAVVISGLNVFLLGSTTVSGDVLTRRRRRLGAERARRRADARPGRARGARCTRPRGAGRRRAHRGADAARVPPRRLLGDPPAGAASPFFRVRRARASTGSHPPAAVAHPLDDGTRRAARARPRRDRVEPRARHATRTAGSSSRSSRAGRRSSRCCSGRSRRRLRALRAACSGSPRSLAGRAR